MLFKIITIALLFLSPTQDKLADRIVAVVNDDLVLMSQLQQWVPIAAEDSSSQQPVQRLEALINQTLILQEIDRLKLYSVSEEEINPLRQQLIQRAGSIAQWQAQLRQNLLQPEQADAFLRRYLLIQKFIEFRFRRVTAISFDEIETYYKDEFLPSFRSQQPDNQPPDLAAITELISNLLTERKVSDALNVWLSETRNKSRISVRY
jgi:hypothetical protein